MYGMSLAIFEWQAQRDLRLGTLWASQPGKEARWYEMVGQHPGVEWAIAPVGSPYEEKGLDDD